MTTDTTVPPLRTELAAACGAARAGGRVATRFYGSARVVEKEGGSPVTEADHAANRAIVDARAAGGDVTDCRGGPLRYNQPDPRQPHGIVACGPGVLERVLGRIRRVYEAAA